MNIKWTDKITNEELWRITKQKPIEIQIKKKMELDRTHIT
jgi:trehalose utilization protein